MSTPKETKPRAFRRRYFIDSAIQGPIIAYIVALIVLSFGGFGILFWKGYQDYIATAKSVLSPSDFEAIAVHLRDGQSLAMSILQYCFVAALIIASIGGLFVSHRIAGPIYRLRKTLRRIRDEGKPVQVSFRTGDYTTGLGVDFNEAMKVLEKR